MTVGKDLRRQAQRELSLAITIIRLLRRRKLPSPAGNVHSGRGRIYFLRKPVYIRAPATGSEVYDSAQARAIMIKSVGGLGCMEG